MTGVKPPELEALVELPRHYIEQWTWFLELNEARSSNGFSFNPISYSDILSFFKLKRLTAEIWEIDLIKRLDREVLRIYAEKAKAESKKTRKN